MSRRDTIVIAVLLNIGVLAVLFTLAVSTEQEKNADLSEISHEIAKVGESGRRVDDRQIQASVKEPQLDEVDSVLTEYVSSSQSEFILPYEDQMTSYEPKISEKPASVSARNVSDYSSRIGQAWSKFVEITVKKGDVLDRIARANGTTVEAIKSVNQLKSEHLKIGQVLRVPIGSAKKTGSALQEAGAAGGSRTLESGIIASAEAQYYTIRSGDNPWKIAKEFHVKMDDLLKLNNLNEEKARNLKPGDKIRVK